MRGRARTALVRCIGAPRPIRARQLCTGRSPGSRLGDFSPSARLLAFSCNGIRARYSRLQLRGQPRIGGGFHRLSRSRL